MSAKPPYPQAGSLAPLSKRRIKQWCYECRTYTLVHRYPTLLLEEVIYLCDGCAEGTTP